MLTIQSIQLNAGSKCLLNNASLTLHPGHKIGIVGQNGAGKTTLFKAILGEVSLDAGQISMPANWTLSYVEQQDSPGLVTALDYVISGHQQYHALQQQLAQTDDSAKLVEIYDQLDKIQGYQIPVEAEQLLAGLGFEKSEFNQQVNEFSGGWQVRLKLARALIQPADLLLLDEPTNHLDLEAVSWLTAWLKTYPGALLVISHDRYFLDQVINGIAEISNQKIYFYSGNFASFEQQKAEHIMQQQALADQQKQRMQQLKTFIDRFKAKASKAKQAQSRVKALSRMELIAPLQAINPIKFEFLPPKSLPDPMLQVEDLAFSYPSKTMFSNVNLTLRAGDRIGLVGVNGSGKTTFLKMLVGENSPTAGKIQAAKGLQIGYFAQQQVENLDVSKTPVDLFLQQFPEQTNQQARDFLGGFGFQNEMALASIADFSGGEKARLALALIIFSQPNLLILDEPTNHLDMDARDALDQALQDFGGALLLVSHDRNLLAGLVDQFWWVHQQQINQFYGDLDDYLQQRLQAIKALNATTRPGSADNAANNEANNEVSKKQQRQQNAQLRKQQQQATASQTKRIKQIEPRLEQLQQDLDQTLQALSDEQIYQAENAEKLAQAIESQHKFQAEIEKLELEWLDLQDQVEQILQSFEQ